ncbi:GntR family transcriptional regulator [Streptomyces sp. NBC_00237]|uniref:GntR family transcriptional regulator n=1 Tax=Streptomyces sp. NBC_00237 TaxID=2975687 RepID=UPI0022543817|nr:GntR family transcriptional regulator [Streptomyces sp. NBC_00237]MCX5202449.1 GntR family transcriptional regulator [Streptomyces sp. NBC_00237]
MVSSQDPRPPFAQVADALRHDIASGALPPGGKLPSFAELRDRFEVSVTTAQRALRELKEDGLVEGRVGKGTFVREKRRMFVHSSSYTAPTESGRWAWGEEAERHGMTGSQRMRPVRELPASEDVADRLDIAVGEPVILRARVMLLDGEPVELVDSYYPATIARGTPLERQERIKGGSPAALVAIGHRAVEYEEKVKATVPTSHESKELSLPAGVPLLRIARTYFDKDGLAVEVCFMAINSERIELNYRLPVHG